MMEQEYVIREGTKVIIFDESKKIGFFGQCIPSINSQTRFLTVKFEDPQMPVLTSTFGHIYIRRKNFLFVIDHRTFNDFALIFSTDELCSSMTNLIQRSEKVDQRCELMEEYFFRNHFYAPILKGIHAGINGAAELKADIMELVKKFTVLKQQEYMILGFQISMTTFPAFPTLEQQSVRVIEFEDVHNQREDTVDASVYEYLKDSYIFDNVMEDGLMHGTSEVESRGVNLRDTNTESSNVSSSTEESSSYYVATVNSSIPSNSTPNFNNAEQSSDDEEEDEMDSGNKNLSSSSTTASTSQSPNSRIIKLPRYKLYTKHYGGILYQRLFIFVSNSTTHGYEYGYHLTRHLFYCYECNRQNLFVTAIHIVDPEGDYIECGSEDHVCIPKAVNEDEGDKRNSRLCKQQQINPSSNVSNISNKRSMKLSKNIRQSSAVSKAKNKIRVLNLPDYQLFERRKPNGQSSLRLFIFDPEDRTVGYEYCYKSNGRYFCAKCMHMKVHLYAKHIRDRNGEHVQLKGAHQHQCNLQQYIPPSDFGLEAVVL